MAQNSAGITAAIFSGWTSGHGHLRIGFRGNSGGAGLMVGLSNIEGCFKL